MTLSNYYCKPILKMTDGDCQVEYLLILIYMNINCPDHDSQ